LINPLKHKTHILNSEGPSWSWSYGSWIYNYLCKQQCLSTLIWWTRTLFIARCTRYNAMWWIFVCQWQVGGFLLYSTN